MNKKLNCSILFLGALFAFMAFPDVGAQHEADDREPKSRGADATSISIRFGNPVILQGRLIEEEFVAAPFPRGFFPPRTAHDFTIGLLIGDIHVEEIIYAETSGASAVGLRENGEANEKIRIGVPYMKSRKPESDVVPLVRVKPDRPVIFVLEFNSFIETFVVEECLEASEMERILQYVESRKLANRKWAEYFSRKVD